MNYTDQQELIRWIRSMRYDKDTQWVSELLLSLFTENNSYPIPVIQIANNLGIHVYKQNMKGNEVSAFLLVTTESRLGFQPGPYIVVNGCETNTMKRFAIAHEIGHFLYDVSEGKEYYHILNSGIYKDITNLAESHQLSDSLAVNLLMPSLDFKRIYYSLVYRRECTTPANAFLPLANYFGVPEFAVELRCGELGLDCYR